MAHIYARLVSKNKHRRASKMSLIIGLTGGIASGKSTVSTMFTALDIPVIDADKVARQVVEPGEQAYHEIIQVFGSDIVNEDHTLDRKKLGSIVFANENKRKQLNAIVHPAVNREMKKQKLAHINASEKCIVLDIPLLFENKLTDIVDQTIVVYVDENTQLERLLARDQFTRKEASQRIASQIPLQDKAKWADAIIDNNGSKEKTKKQFTEILRKWHVI